MIFCKPLLYTLRCSEHFLYYLKMWSFLLLAGSVISSSQIFDRKNVSSSWHIFPSSEMFQWHFRLILFLPVKKLSFSLKKFYCQGRLTGGVKNKKTCQTFVLFLSMGHWFIQSFTRLVHSFRSSRVLVYIFHIFKWSNYWENSQII